MTMPRSWRDSDPMIGAPVVVPELGDHLTLHICGDVDAATGPALHAHLDTLVAGCPARHVTVDIAGVGFCDTAGIRAFAGVAETAAKGGHTCDVRGASAHIAAMFALCGVGHLLS